MAFKNRCCLSVATAVVLSLPCQVLKKIKKKKLRRHTYWALCWTLQGGHVKDFPCSDIFAGLKRFWLLLPTTLLVQSVLAYHPVIDVRRGFVIYKGIQPLFILVLVRRSLANHMFFLTRTRWRIRPGSSTAQILVQCAVGPIRERGICLGDSFKNFIFLIFPSRQFSHGTTSLSNLGFQRTSSNFVRRYSLSKRCVDFPKPCMPALDPRRPPLFSSLLSEKPQHNDMNHCRTPLMYTGLSGLSMHPSSDKIAGRHLM